ncbi:hypothetical protein DRE_07163 [Drechslerella stenobrocha 248]|uniref:Rab GDP dissociation inhibitor n=1 Tax=Drechslerella stenobrocha 248 TaxID=1043628 RepID=W7HJJ3_9PEZI|nr:hypothetical protein DRE_07163 [Drechslerella stenobrocha 248]
MSDEQDATKDLEKGFDVVVLGTGLTETILSGIMSVEGKRVLHIDSNDYYGGEGASLKMSQVFKRFTEGDVKPPPGLDNDRDWNIDLIPKFMMAGGELARILRNFRQVQDNVQFLQVAGSYVYRAASGFFGTMSPAIYKVPSSASEALTSSLVGFNEKRRLKSFLEFVAAYDGESPLYQGMDLEKTTMSTIYEKFSLDKDTQDFVGHAMALYSDKDHQNFYARPTFNKIRLYASSVALYGKSPYIYPLYGLGELPSAFTRLSAVHGGTYMLSTKVLGFEHVDDKVSGVKIRFENPKKDGEYLERVIKTPRVLAAPSYVDEPKKKKRTGQQVVRAICVLEHKVRGADKGSDDNCQIIIPGTQVNRTHDIYIAVLSSAHNVCPKNYWLAIVSTVVETDNPLHELKPGFELLEPIKERFLEKPSYLWEPADDASDNVFVSKSLDASSHFESCTDDVKDLYRRMEGRELDIDGLKVPEQSQD